MTKAFHYTPVEKYNEIRKSGVLTPNSPIIQPKWAEKCHGLEIPDEIYTFGFLESQSPES